MISLIQRQQNHITVPQDNIMPNVGCVVRDFFNLKGYCHCLVLIRCVLGCIFALAYLGWNGTVSKLFTKSTSDTVWFRSGFYQHFEQHSSIISEDPVASMSRRCQMCVNSIWGHLRYLHCIFKLGYQCRRHDVVLIDWLIDLLTDSLIDWLIGSWFTPYR